jgi:peroxiredoxin
MNRITILRRTALVAVATVAAASAGLAVAQTSPVATVGQAAPGFTAKDIAGKTVSLADHKGKWVVLEWTNPECPYVQKHYDSGNMPATMKRAVAGGAVWLGVSTGEHTAGTGRELASWLQAKGAAPTALVLDGDGRIGKAYGAKTTPHMYLIDPQGKLAYAGAIDSKPTANKADIAGATNYVDAALADAKAGRPIAQAQTRAYGCTVKYPSAG